MTAVKRRKKGKIMKKKERMIMRKRMRGKITRMKIGKSNSKDDDAEE